MQPHLFGVDLGGTKVECAVLPHDNLREPLCRVRLPTEAEHGFAHVVDQIVRTVEQAVAQSGAPRPARIGLGTPGITDPDTGLMRGSNAVCLNGGPLRDEVAAKLGMEVVAANDANCFALAEATIGCAVGYPTVFGVILGTGVGGGIIVDGKVLPGRHEIAGEWGQVILDPHGPAAGHGVAGTIEAHIAGPALERYYAEATGQPLKLKEIAARAQEGNDPAANATIDRLTTLFAKSIAAIVNVLDPHAIVLGGGVGNIEALYTPETRAKISDEIFVDHFQAALLKPELGDSAGVFGAAMLVQ